MASEENLDSNIEEYKKWIEKDIPVSNDWIDELNYISSIREDIHRYVTNTQPDSAILDTIRSLDTK